MCIRDRKCAHRMQQKVIRRNAETQGHSHIHGKHGSESNDIRQAFPSMCQPHAEKWHQVQEGQSKRGDQSARPLKRQNRKEILGQIINDSHRAIRPAYRNQIASKNVALGETGVLHHLAQLHIVEHFHPQRFVSPHRLVYACLLYTSRCV